MMTELHPVEKEQVMAFLDGELDPKLAAQVATHIAECADCQSLQNELRGVSSRMLAWNVEAAPEKLTQAVMAAAQTDESKRGVGQRKLRLKVPLWRRIVFSRLTWVTTCLILCVAIGFMFYAPSYFHVSRLSGLASREGGDYFAPMMNSPAPSKVNGKVRNRGGGGGGGGGGNDALRPGNDPLLYVPGAGLTELEQDISSGPMIARTASLKMSVKDVDAARAALDKVLQQYHGYAASLTIHSEIGAPRSIDSEVHIPAAQSDAALATLKSLGRVEQEEQGGEEVTAQVIDLDARLKNAHETETRLQDILRTRTGKVSEVLEVEKVMADTRESIERMEAERKELRGRVAYSSIKLDLHEEYQATLGQGTSVGRQIRNAIVDGFQAAGSGALALFVWLLSVLPSLLLAAALLFFPVRWTWRRYHKNMKDWAARNRGEQAQA
jgi:hypothetical protein